MSKRTTSLRLSVARIAMALAVAGIGLAFGAGAGAAQTSVESSDVGAIVDSDDDDGLGRNARISSIVNAGTYTIEATTFRRETTGSFSLALAVSAAPAPTDTPTPTFTPTPTYTPTPTPTATPRASSRLPVPSNFTTTASSASSIRVSWTAPTRTFSQYQLQYRIYTSNTWTSITVSRTDTAKSLSDLRCNTWYSFRIRAGQRSGGSVSWGQWVTGGVTTSGCPATYYPNEGDIYYNGTLQASATMQWRNPGGWISKNVCVPLKINCATYEHDLSLNRNFFEPQTIITPSRTSPYIIDWCTTVTNLPSSYDDCPTAGWDENEETIYVYSFASGRAHSIRANYGYYGFWNFRRKGSVTTATVSLDGQQGYHRVWGLCPTPPNALPTAGWCVLSHRGSTQLLTSTAWTHGTASLHTWTKR